MGWGKDRPGRVPTPPSVLCFVKEASLSGPPGGSYEAQCPGFARHAGPWSSVFLRSALLALDRVTGWHQIAGLNMGKNAQVWWLDKWVVLFLLACHDEIDMLTWLVHLVSYWAS